MKGRAVTIRVPFHLSGLAAAGVLLVVSGCSSLSLEGKKIDYRSASRAPSLEVPPDLTAPVYDDRYQAITASGQAAAQAARAPSAQASVLLPVTDKVRIERGGGQRWLVVSLPPEAVWNTVRDFWQQTGFNVVIERPESGIMETDWAENRAKIPDDIFRRTLGRVLDFAYSTNERDKFRTRIEPGIEAGTTEVYVSHRGLEEVARPAPGGGTAGNGFVWQARPVDADLEADFLRRMMVKFGVPEAQSRQVVAAAAAATPVDRAKIERLNEGGAQLVVDDSFDRAWRRVGLALDRVGFTVVDRDRSKGLYFVRFADPDTDAGRKKDEGWLSKLAFWRSDEKEKPEQYQIVVTELPSKSVVVVQDPSGAPNRTPAADRILALLQGQLK